MDLKKKPDQFSKKQPYISIIVPTYNRQKALKQCLMSLVSLEADRSCFEVIVVDDGSEKNCKHLVEEIVSSLDWTYLRQKNQGPAAARNLGATHSKGMYLAFLDDDCTLPTYWFDKVYNLLNKKAMLGGHTVNMFNNNIFSTASQDLVEYLYSYFNNPPLQAQFITSNNMIVPAPLFKSIRGFSTYFTNAAGEDRDFCDKWLCAGYRIQYIPEIVVEHWHKMNCVQFLRQHFSYGHGAWMYHNLRKLRNGEPIKIEPLKFYENLLLFPFQKQKKLREALLSLCLCLSQICNAGGFFWAKLSFTFLNKHTKSR